MLKDFSHEITREDIEAILRFIPIFETHGYTFGSWDLQEGCMPYAELNDEPSKFISALEKHGWVVRFDWPAWLEESGFDIHSKEVLKEANLETIRKVITAHVRGDRFCEGHLLTMLEDGYFTALLKRIEQITDSCI